MAKKSISIKFTKATLSKENDKYIVTEITKDDSTDYNFSAILDSLEGSEGLSITITSEDNIQPVGDDEVDE